jgi:ATP/maltotriose-dependent transcriptional regulator MalT
MLVKSDSIEEKKTKIIVVLDDLHLASEQSSEMLRFMLENKRFFETRTK